MVDQFNRVRVRFPYGGLKNITMETPEGYPYLKLNCITERLQYHKEDEREETYYELNPIVMDIRMVKPVYWHRYKVRNPDTLQLETCVLLAFVDIVGTPSELMIAETFPKFDKLIKEWITYAEQNDTTKISS